MQIETVQPGPHVDLSVDGAVVTVGGLTIDCAARQADSRVLVDVMADGGDIAEGGSGDRVAAIAIPPRQYTTEDGGLDEDGNPTTVEVAQPLDPSRVVIRLWTYTG